MQDVTKERDLDQPKPIRWIDIVSLDPESDEEQKALRETWAKVLPERIFFNDAATKV